MFTSESTATNGSSMSSEAIRAEGKGLGDPDAPCRDDDDGPPSPGVDVHAVLGLPRPKRPSERSEEAEEIEGTLWGFSLKNRSIVKCTHLYDETQGTTKRKSFRQKIVFVGCKKIDREIIIKEV